ncbi:hypothetical protein RHM65_22355 [Pseudomonas sp. CCI4.2]|uniref:hypothetical protein n=1 Tax=Pseudomonas sp. CCI4.2 TaxID=3048620 RepID=UPI002AC8EC53|nr:hypothetical protein [Pseudomonas sp. CCI4.2]MEB0090051.1 hypothetical protein [Pseudomonas sp. CCI4.2]WPX53484.1 hypothetical protein RHM65_22355 [Pseudomonas sp. CCI4.2]
MNGLPAVQEYQDMLKASALSFLKRHQGEHLGEPVKLLDRAINHLVSSFNETESAAIKLVSLAFIDLTGISLRQRIDLDYSTDTTVVVRDPVKGLSWAIPVDLIYDRIIKAPDAGRLRLTLH